MTLQPTLPKHGGEADSTLVSGQKGRGFGRSKWPPKDRQQPHEDPPYAHEWMKRIDAVTANWDRLLESIVPQVVGEWTVQLDGNGIATRQIKVPYAALAVTSLSSFPLILTNSSQQAGAPGPGPGSAVIPSYGSAAVNMKGLAWTLYGGLPGDQVTVQALAKPIPPVSSAGGAYATAQQVYSNLAGGTGPALTASGQTAPLAVSPFSLLGLMISVGAVSGTNPTLQLAISGVDPGGNLYPYAQSPVITTPGQLQINAGETVSPSGNPVTATAAFAGAGNGTATLAAGASIAGFDVTTAAPAGAESLTVTVVGAQGGTLTWDLAANGNAEVPLSIRFPVPLQPANPAVGIAVTVTGGTGTPAGVIDAYGIAAPGQLSGGLVLPPRVVVAWTIGGSASPTFTNTQLTLYGRE